jgi:glycosyltransferase involved in cell wall biosynthesis
MPDTPKPAATPLATRDYVLISPCRNEAAFMVRTLDSVIAQSLRPALWVIVDDGSTDETPKILADYAARHDWIRVVPKPDRGHRAVGPGVIEAFYAGYDTVSKDRFPYLCKLDLDLDLPPRYFEILVERMEADPRLGTCSGKPYVRQNGRLVSERRGDEMSVGMTKFYRRSCFEDIGGFIPEVMWDAIDCHKARQLGWRAVSWDEPDLRFEHLRPMGSSQTSIYTDLGTWPQRLDACRRSKFELSDVRYFRHRHVFRYANAHDLIFDPVRGPKRGFGRARIAPGCTGGLALGRLNPGALQDWGPKSGARSLPIAPGCTGRARLNLGALAIGAKRGSRPAGFAPGCTGVL